MIRTDTVNYVRGEGGHMGLMAEINTLRFDNF